MKTWIKTIGLLFAGVALSVSAAPDWTRSGSFALDTRDDEAPGWNFAPTNTVETRYSAAMIAFSQTSAVDTTYAYSEVREYSGCTVFFTHVSLAGSSREGATEWVESMKEIAVGLRDGFAQGLIVEKGLHVTSRLLNGMIGVLLEMPTTAGDYWHCNSYLALNKLMWPMQHLDLPAENNYEITPIVHFSSSGMAIPPRSLLVTHTVGGYSYPYATFSLLTENEATEEIWWNHEGLLITIIPNSSLICALEGEYTVEYGSSVSVSSANAIGMFDADNDGLPDDWELDSFSGENCDPNLDPDADRYSNADEYVLGTVPTDSSSTFAVTANSEGLYSEAAPTVQISFPTVLGRNYAVQSCEKLDAAQWFTKTNFAGTGENMTYIEDAMVSNRFYRVGVSLP